MAQLRRVTFAALAGALALACGGGPSDPTTSPPATSDGVAGDVRTDAAGWVAYTIGDAPLIISAPHGGLLAPASLPDRSCSGCVTVNDDNIQDLARRVAAQFKERTGKRPHLVINLLRRAKFDANREVVEATGNNAALTATWSTYHGYIESARSRITAAQGRGLLLDLHGHAHAVPRLELGYMLSAASLRLSDQALGASSAIVSSSIGRLSLDAIDRPSSVELLRGPTSMGALFVRWGYPAVPSPSDVAPAANEEYYNGGYITQRHGSSSGGSVDAVQIEANRIGVRDTPANLDRYAAAIVSVALEYLGRHYGWPPTSTVAMAPPWLPGAGRMAATLRSRASAQRSAPRAAQASP